MSRPADIAWSQRLARTSPAVTALWTLSAVLMFTAHAGAGWWLMRQPAAPLAEQDAAPMAVMIDLASIAMAPASTEDQVAPDEYDSVEVEAQQAVPVEDLAEPIETAEPVEPVETAALETPVEPVVEQAEPVQEAQPVETPETPEPVETATVAPVDTVEPDEPVEEPERLAAIPADAVDPTLTEPTAPSEVTAARAVDPEAAVPVEEEVDPVEQMVVAALARPDIPVPHARPEPPKQVQREQPKQEQPRREAQKPREKPAERPRQQAQAPSRAASQAKSTTAQQAPRAAAPQTSSGSASNVSPARWQSRLMAHLERRKRYPSAAKRQRKQGVAQVRFSIDANGNVGSVSLTRSSGVPELDAEVVSLVRRASPVPAPPPGVNRTIVVPIQFSLR